MKPKIDLIGKKFGKLTVVKFLGRLNKTPSDPHNYVLCKCLCGNDKITRVSRVLSGGARSCGCLVIESAKKLSIVNTKHGKCGTTEYTTWRCIKDRCYNENNGEYFRYGGRGIRMSERWRYDFNKFFKDMGEKPTPQHSIDRIDNTKGYNKANCRWATKKEQSFNRAVTLPTYTYKVIEDIQKQNNISFRTAYLRFYRSANYILKRDQRKKKENERSKRKTN